MPEQKVKEMAGLADVTAVGGLWFDTAIAKLRFANNCCQQRAGCCQRISAEKALSVDEFAKAIKGIG